LGKVLPADTAAEERFERMYAAHERAIYAYCLRRVDREGALDCAAETFAIAWRRLDDVPDDDRAIRWLYRVAHNVIGNHYRSRNRRRRYVAPLEASELETVDHHDGPETIVIRQETDREVFEALQRLKPADRQVLLLSAWEGMAHADIGEIVGCSAHVVDQRIHRAIRRLGKELGAPRNIRSRRRLLVPAQEEVTDVDAS